MVDQGDQDIPWHLLLSGVMLLVVLLVMGMIYKERVSDDTLEKVIIARDISLLLDVMYAAPGDVQYVYDLGDLSYGISVENGVVQVLDPDSKVVYVYGEDTGFENPVLEAGQPVSQIQITKRDGIVRVVGVTDNTNDNANSEFFRLRTLLVEQVNAEDGCAVKFQFDTFLLNSEYFVRLIDDVLRLEHQTDEDITRIQAMNARNIVITDAKSQDAFDAVLDNPQYVNAIISPFGVPPLNPPSVILNARNLIIVKSNARLVIAEDHPFIEVPECVSKEA